MECTCPDGSTGAQVCQSDGTWGECVCDPGQPDPEPTTDAGYDNANLNDNANNTDENDEPYGDPDEYPAKLWNYPEPDIDTVINLNEEGLLQGGLVDDYIDDYWDNGVRLVADYSKTTTSPISASEMTGRQCTTPRSSSMTKRRLRGRSTNGGCACAIPHLTSTTTIC